MQYENLSQELVDRCLSRGADSAEVLMEEGRQLSIEVRNGEMETIQESSSHGAGFRVFRDGKMGFAHSNDLSDTSLNEAISSAVDFSQHMTADEHNILPSTPGITEVEGLYDPDLAGVSMERKIAMATEVEALAMSDSRITKSDGARWSEGEGSVFLANSNGLVKSYQAGMCGYGVTVVAEKGDQKCSGGEFSTRRYFSDLVSPEEVAEEATRSAYEMLDPRMVRTQRAAVVFDPDVARSLLGGLIGAINGERVLQGASFLADSVGEKISSDLLTIVDDGTLPGIPGRRGEHRKRLSRWICQPSRDRPPCLLRGSRRDGPGRDHPCDSERPVPDGCHRLWNQSGKRELQRGGTGVLDREREARLPGEGAHHRRQRQRDAERNRHAGHRSGPEQDLHCPHLQDQGDADRGSVGKLFSSFCPALPLTSTLRCPRGPERRGSRRTYPGRGGPSPLEADP